MDQFNVYKDMKARTNGEIYIGVVGPVRTGKSTFIKRFMNLMVLPNIEDENLSGRIRKDTEEEHQALFVSGSKRLIDCQLHRERYNLNRKRERNEDKENNTYGSYTNGCRFFTGTEQECRDQYIHLERYMHATA